MTAANQNGVDARPGEPATAAAVRTLSFGGKTLALVEAEAAVKSSGSWFWWIAALSLVNSVSQVLQLDYGMVLGLGITQLFDALILLDAEGQVRDVSPLARGIHLALVLAAAGFFYQLGVRARAQSVRAFRVGMIVYALDGGLFLLVGDWIGVGFHAFVLFFLWGGYGLAKALSAAKAQPAAP